MADQLGYAGLDVLDVGCGQGIDLVRYARAGANVTGIDLTPRHAELAREHLAGHGLPGTVVLGDAEELPFPDDSFDRVSSNAVLHHTPNIEAALREIRRVLRPGGEARIIVRSMEAVLAQVEHSTPWTAAYGISTPTTRSSRRGSSGSSPRYATRAGSIGSAHCPAGT